MAATGSAVDRRDPRGTSLLAAVMLFVVMLATVSTLTREMFAEPAQRLWMASDAMIKVVDSQSGSTLSQIDVDGVLRAFALESGGAAVWAVVGDELREYAGNGELRRALPLEIPSEGRAALALDRASGDIWIATDTIVILLDAGGQRRWSRPLRGPLVELALDARRSWVWVATADQLELLDDQGRLLQQLSLINIGPVRALAYDPHLDQAWIIGDGTLERYTWEGERTLAKVLPVDHDLTKAVVDGQGGLWAASALKLFHFDAEGEAASLSTRLSMGSAGGPIDLVSDAAEGAVWVAGRDDLRRIGYSGALLSKMALPDAGDTPWLQAMLETGG